MQIIGFYYNANVETSKEFTKREIKKYQKQLYRFTVASVVSALMYTRTAYANPFDPIGSKFWGYVKGFGAWACLIMCGLEVIKALGSGDHKAILKIILKYGLAYASFSIMPWIFNEIDSTFKVIK